MNTHDHIGDDPQRDRDGETKPTRDARGRWLPGHCPNPKGRPRKRPKGFISESDLQIFGNTLVDVMANGQLETMDRQTALLNKIFESAMKGRVSNQRFLYKEFQKNVERLARARVRYERLLFDWIIDNPNFGKRGFDIPTEVEVEMTSLGALLNHYYPEQYPLYGGSARPGDDADEN